MASHPFWDSKFVKGHYFMLKILGLWPSNNNYEVNAYKVYSFTSIFICIALNAMFQTLAIPFILDDLEALTSTIFVNFTCWFTVVKVYNYIRSMPVLKQLRQKSEQPLFQYKTPQQTRLIDQGLFSWKIIYSMYTGVGFWTIIFWAIYPIMDQSQTRRLPIQAWYPGNFTESPMYELIYAYQMVATTFLAYSNINMETSMALWMVFIGIQCEFLCDNLRRLRFARAESRKSNANLIECVNHHREIVGFARKLNKCFDLIIFVQMFTSIVSIGMSLFQLTVVRFNTMEAYSYICYGVGMTVEILCYCWFGNEVLVKSQQIPSAIFESPWNDAPVETQKSVLFFLRRTQEPISPSALGVFFINLETFKAIMKTSWSLFTLLNQVNSQ